MGERSDTDALVTGLIAVGIGVVSSVVALCLLVGVQRLKRRLGDLEQLHAEQVTRLNGPSVREYCRSLIAALGLRAPRRKQPHAPSEAESDLIESLRLHARVYRKMTRKPSGAAAEPMNEEIAGSARRPTAGQHADSDEPSPEGDRTMNDESIDAILVEAEQAAAVEAEETVQPTAEAAEGDAVHQEAAEEVFASMPAAKPENVASVDAVADPSDEADHDTQKAADGIGGSPDAPALQELCVQAESLGRVLTELTERMGTERAAAEQILARVDQRIEVLQAASQAVAPGTSSVASDVPADMPVETPSIAEASQATAPSPEPVSPPSRNADPHSPAGELQVLNASLIEHLSQRKKLLNRIDEAFRDRQMNLAAEILQAETGQVELGDALEKIEAAVSTIQALAHEASPELQGIA